jgi:hypothetical protein
VDTPVERLAQELGLDHARLTVSGRAGRRTIFGSSAELHHTLASELSAVTFVSNADLIQRWVNVLHFALARDWTWDGLAEAGLEIRRIVKRPRPDGGVDVVDQLAGTFSCLPQSLSRRVLACQPMCAHRRGSSRTSSSSTRSIRNRRPVNFPQR